MTLAVKVAFCAVGASSWASLFFIPPKTTTDLDYFLSELKNRKYKKREESKLKTVRHEDLKQGDGQNFALGCHAILFQGRNLLKINETKYSQKGSDKDFTNSGRESPDNYYYWGDKNYPLLGCSTAFIRKETTGNKKIFEFELALKQGDKGLIERISVKEDKIISQITFYEKDRDYHNQWPYINRFALLRRKEQNHKSGPNSIYKWFDPSNTSNPSWSTLDLSAVTENNQAKYFVVWEEGSNRDSERIFDNLGIKSKDKIFSSVAELNDSENDKFWYFPKKPDTEANQTKYYVHTDKHAKTYPLTALSGLSSDIYSRRGKWTDIQMFCKSFETEGSQSQQDKPSKTIEIREEVSLRSCCCDTPLYK